MADLNRRRLSLLMLAPFFATLARAQAAKTGVKVRFRITERIQKAEGKAETRTYENAVLVSFGEKFTGDLHNEFRISLMATEMDKSANVEIAVHDIRRGGSFAGQGSAVVPFGGETLLELSKGDERTYSVILRAERHELPKTP